MQHIIKLLQQVNLLPHMIKLFYVGLGVGVTFFSAQHFSEVAVILETHERQIVVNVIDNGPGVPEKIRESLFEPFVSEGKQKGTGLGLTLAHTIAFEHGGEVVLLSSRPGETIFQMKVARELPMQDPSDVSEHNRHDQVTPDENVRT